MCVAQGIVRFDPKINDLESGTRSNFLRRLHRWQDAAYPELAHSLGAYGWRSGARSFKRSEWCAHSDRGSGAGISDPLAARVAASARGRGRGKS